MKIWSVIYVTNIIWNFIQFFHISVSIFFNSFDEWKMRYIRVGLSAVLYICRFDTLKIISFRIVEISLWMHKNWLLDGIIPMHRVRVAHRRINTGMVISRRSRARAVARAIQTPFFVIYDNTYAVERITARSGRRRRSGFV